MIRFHTDHYFSIGHAHLGQGKPCQDFALSGNVADAAFAIVADGCSSGGLTDVGARVIALSTAQSIRSCVKVLSDWSHIQPMVQIQQELALGQSQKLLGLKHSDMLATCIYSLFSSKGGFVHMHGDGVIAYKYRNGVISLTKFDWAGNAPAYLAYAEDKYAAFIAAQGSDLNAIKLTSEIWDYSPRKGFQNEGGDKISLGEGVSGYTEYFTPEELEDLEFIAVFTDGVTQIENIDWKTAVVELLGFKGVAGEFAKRRMIRYIKDSQKMGKGPLDDIAYSVIRIESSQEEEVPDDA